MRFCIYCGSSVLDGERFCSHCGAAVQQSAPAPVSAPAPTPMYAPAPVPPKPQIPALASNERTARMYVRHVAGSSMALFFAIMMTLVQLLNLYTVFNPLYALTAEELEAAGAVLDLQSFANMVTGISLVSTIPSILLLIGIWITVGKARSGPELQSAGGLRLINGTLKAMRIITPCLALVAGILIMALFAGIPELQLKGATLSVVGFFVVVIFAAAGAFSVFVYCKMIRTVEAIASSVELNRPMEGISRFVCVMSFISAGTVASSALGSGWIGFAVGALTVATQIIIGCTLLKMRKTFQLIAYHDRLVETQDQEGGWVCTCGRMNVEHVQYCSCGRGRPGMVYQPDPAQKWACRNCEYVNLPTSRVCIRCGEIRLNVETKRM